MLATDEQQNAEAAGDSSHASDKPVPTPPWHVAQARDSKQGTGEDLQAVHRQETQAGYNKHVYGEHHMAEQQQHNAEQQQVAQAQDSKRETGDDRQAVHQQEVQSQAFLLPHEMLAAIYNDYPEMWRTIISSDATTLVDFWNDQTGHPQMQGHPVKSRLGWKSKAVPIAFHGDGVPVRRKNFSSIVIRKKLKNHA